MKVNAIIVGADGTDSSKAAVRWAAREAQRRVLPLRVTHVYDWEWREARYDSSNVYLDDARRHAEGKYFGDHPDGIGPTLGMDVSKS